MDALAGYERLDDITATYSPEDNKLRLYSGRVPRETYERLREAGYYPTPKQSCSFAAPWSLRAEDMALSLIAEWDDIGDEQYSLADRSADRAERFAGYRDKRATEAVGRAESIGVVGVASDRVAGIEQRRIDRASRYCSRQWSKADYWRERTRGVIAHALFKLSPKVRRGRVVEIESELARLRKRYKPEAFDKSDNLRRYVAHLELRLGYEQEMLAAEGGSATDCDMVVGGWIGSHQIHKINRSNLTGKIVSVGLYCEHPWRKGRDGQPLMAVQPFNIQRLPAGKYRAPTPEEVEAFAPTRKAASALPPILTPSRELAEAIQAYWNRSAAAAYLAKSSTDGRREGDKSWSEIMAVVADEMTQHKYSQLSKGDCCYCSMSTLTGPDGVAVRVRKRHAGFYNYNLPSRVIVLTDKSPSNAPAWLLELVKGGSVCQAE